jgi:hypothetical protein
VIAIAWGLIWLPVGIAFGLTSNADRGTDVPGQIDYIDGPSVAWFAIAWTLWGTVSGALFAFLLAFTESGRSVTTLSTWRISVWGALGCMAIPFALTIFDITTGPWAFWSYDWLPAVLVLGVSALLGAVCAAGTLAVVRRTPAGAA